MPPFPRDRLPHAEGLVLRPVEERDQAELVRIRQDAETIRWSDPDGFTDVEARDSVLLSRRGWQEGRSAQFAVTAEGDDRTLLGTVTLVLLADTRASIGYGVAEEARGRGVATRALEAVARWAFDVVPSLVRLELWVIPGNDASARVAERAGFRREGVLRARHLHAGVPTDVISFSLLRGEL